jgi:hypothetical protein
MSSLQETLHGDMVTSGNAPPPFRGRGMWRAKELPASVHRFRPVLSIMGMNMAWTGVLSAHCPVLSDPLVSGRLPQEVTTHHGTWVVVLHSVTPLWPKTGHHRTPDTNPQGCLSLRMYSLPR